MIDFFHSSFANALRKWAFRSRFHFNVLIGTKIFAEPNWMKNEWKKRNEAGLHHNHQCVLCCIVMRSVFFFSHYFFLFKFILTIGTNEVLSHNSQMWTELSGSCHFIRFLLCLCIVIYVTQRRIHHLKFVEQFKCKWPGLYLNHLNYKVFSRMTTTRTRNYHIFVFLIFIFSLVYVAGAYPS